MLPRSPQPLISIIENRQCLLAMGKHKLVVLLDHLNERVPPSFPIPCPVIDVHAIEETAVRGSREDGFLIQDPQ